MTKTLKFWYEFASPYSYIAMMRIEALARQAGAEIVYQPFVLGPLFKAFGWNTSPFNIFPEKGENFLRDIERECAHYDLPQMKMPDPFPQNTLLAARLALVGLDEGWGIEFSKQVFLREFAEGRSIATLEDLAPILDSVVPNDLDGVREAAVSDATKARLRAVTEQAKAAKLFGAPSFQVGDELFWGNDRLERALSYL